MWLSVQVNVRSMYVGRWNGVYLIVALIRETRSRSALAMAVMDRCRILVKRSSLVGKREEVGIASGDGVSKVCNIR